MGFGMTATILGLFIVSSLHSPTSMVSALNANVSKALVYANYGQDAEIFCFAPPEAVQALPPSVDRLCRFYLVDKHDETKRRTVLNATGSQITGQFGPGKYGYIGAGVREGECGLKIYSVAAEQVGEWGCAFIAGQIWQATIQVLKYEKPEPPTIAVDGDKAEINVTDWQNDTIVQNSTQILCCSIGGKPISDTRLALYLDDQELPDIVLKKNDSSSTCIQVDKTFTKEDNEKSLICKVSHPGLIDVDEDSQEIQYSVIVNVEYSPEIIYPDGDDITRRGDFITKKVYRNDPNQVDLYFTVRGNPIPSVVMKRNFTNIDSRTVELVEIDVKKVEVHSKNNSHEFIVTIDAPSDKEGEFECEITVENSLGKDSGTTIVSPPDGESGSKIWIMIVVGVVMSLFFIGIILYFLNKQAKNRGWFGYEARVEKYKAAKIAKTLNTPSNREYTCVAEMDESKF